MTQSMVVFAVDVQKYVAAREGSKEWKQALAHSFRSRQVRQAQGEATAALYNARFAAGIGGARIFDKYPVVDDHEPNWDIFNASAS